MPSTNLITLCLKELFLYNDYLSANGEQFLPMRLIKNSETNTSPKRNK